MYKKIDFDNIVKFAVITFFVYIALSIQWYGKSSTAPSEENIGMYEYREYCIETYGPINKCFEPFEKRQKSRKNFYKFQTIVLGLSAVSFIGHKSYLHIFPKK